MKDFQIDELYEHLGVSIGRMVELMRSLHEIIIPEDGTNHLIRSHPSIVEELWVVTTDGLNLFNWQAKDKKTPQLPFSLVGGFISALSSFAKEITDRDIDYVKIKNNVLYIQHVRDKIIVAAMLDEVEWTEVEVVTRIIEFVGEEFLSQFEDRLATPAVRAEGIEEQFTPVVDMILNDPEIVTDLRQEVINSTISSVLMKNVDIITLFWRLVRLYGTTSSVEQERAFGIFRQTLNVSNLSDTDLDEELIYSLSTLFEEVGNLLKQRPPSFKQLRELDPFSNLKNKRMLKNFLMYSLICFNFSRGSELQ